MKSTASGDYKLPSPWRCFVGNQLLRLATLAPAGTRQRFVRNHSGYQVFDGQEVGDSEGSSLKKWEAMKLPPDLRGQPVLDIGCAEGFFCRQAAKSGAGPVLGVDTSLARLMCGAFVAQQDRLNIRYKMAVFPNLGIHSQFGYIFCLSVLHHSLINKDLWQVLTRPECSKDLAVLQRELRYLRGLTQKGGKCLLEMPYEYEQQAERTTVDFERFSAQLVEAGFSRAECLGSWEYNPIYQQLKDRYIYVAVA